MFTLEPEEEFKEFLLGMFIPQYGDMVYKRQVLKTKRGTFNDPVNTYFEQLTFFAYSRQAFLEMDLQMGTATYEGDTDEHGRRHGRGKL